MPRVKVTLELDASDVHEVFGTDVDYFLTYGRYRIEVDSKLAGVTFYTAHIDRLGTILALSLIDTEHATPGTEVTMVYGDHPGAGTDPNADLGFSRLRATVQPAPYNEYARTNYRGKALV